MPGTWTLTAPDGRTWLAESPLRAAAAEGRDRVPAEVAIARVLRAANEVTELVTWTRVDDGRPDADQTVQISLDETHSEPTWFGHWDGEQWRDVAGMPITGVLAWAPMLEGLRGD
jgi:hypothetical protein